MRNKIIGIIGTRRRNNLFAFKKIRETFKKIYNEDDIICSGGRSKGGDRCAEQIAKEEGIELITFYSSYKQHSKYASFIRNGKIANKSDILIACVIRPEDGIEKVLKREKGETEDIVKKFMNRTEDLTKIYLV